MVNTKSEVHTSALKMVKPIRRTGRHRDVSLVVPPLQANIHGVCMCGLSSASAKRPRTSSSRRIRDAPVDPSPDV